MLTVIAANGCNRYVVGADEKLTAFLELESSVRAAANCLDWLA